MASKSPKEYTERVKSPTNNEGKGISGLQYLVNQTKRLQSEKRKSLESRKFSHGSSASNNESKSETHRSVDEGATVLDDHLRSFHLSEKRETRRRKGKLSLASHTEGKRESLETKVENTPSEICEIKPRSTTIDQPIHRSSLLIKLDDGATNVKSQISPQKTASPSYFPKGKYKARVKSPTNKSDINIMQDIQYPVQQMQKLLLGGARDNITEVSGATAISQSEKSKSHESIQLSDEPIVSNNEKHRVVDEGAVISEADHRSVRHSEKKETHHRRSRTKSNNESHKTKVDKTSSERSEKKSKSTNNNPLFHRSHPLKTLDDVDTNVHKRMTYWKLQRGTNNESDEDPTKTFQFKSEDVHTVPGSDMRDERKQLSDKTLIQTHDICRTDAIPHTGVRRKSSGRQNTSVSKVAHENDTVNQMQVTSEAALTRKYLTQSDSSTGGDIRYHKPVRMSEKRLSKGRQDIGSRTRQVKDIIQQRDDTDTARKTELQTGTNATLPNAKNVRQSVDFRKIPIIPTTTDLMSKTDPFLKQNKISESYRSADHYLDTQFRLLREDFMIPLRNGVQEVVQYSKRGIRKDYLDDVYVYNRVQQHGTWYSPKGVVYHFTFDVSPFRHVIWRESKRLMSNSLICLSSDGFENIITGVVYDREPNKLQRGQIDILIHNGRLLDTNPFVTYTIVEPTTYFEAYKHNLEVLKQFNQTNLPMQKYLLNKGKEDRPPKYLNSETKYDFQPLLEGNTQTPISVLQTRKWPSHIKMHLDESQYQALKSAVTKEFSIIQGPPGTGKTFIGIKIVQLLLHNYRQWNRMLQKPFSGEATISPILLVCFTNHALDQFLEGILQFTENANGEVIRVGGGSSSENVGVQNCVLHTQAKNRDIIPISVRKAKAYLRELMKVVEESLSELGRNVTKIKQAIIHEQHLLNMMHPNHKNAFEVLKDKTVCHIERWLFANDTSTDTSSVAGCQRLQGDDYDNDEALHSDINLQQKVMDNEPAEKAHRKRKVGELSRKSLDGSYVNVTSSRENPDHGKWAFVMPKQQDIKKILKEKLKCECLSESEESDIMNIWSLPRSMRWRLYKLWITRYCDDCVKRMQPEMEEFNKMAGRLEQLKREKHFCILNGAKVIAMTTTGAAKYRDILERIQPKIVIVEEAAEVLEAHIVTSLTENCQHLILIGDHQQLRPNHAVYKLATQYHLDISLFERMVINKMHCDTLSIQHRMRPEIAKLLVPHIYKHLQNHDSVTCYDNIKGIEGNIFFLTHDEKESHTFDSKSKSNIHEAEFLTSLCKYIIQQGYEQTQVTILTTYRGQMREIKKRTSTEALTKEVRVRPVDSFQGEENDIILLSLVRSNEEGRIGFVKIPNRICVSLSRAKKGFYVVGNFKLLDEISPTWKDILQDMKQKGRLVTGIPLVCQNHPRTKHLVTLPSDFSDMPEGGCSKPCNALLNCHHICDRQCHPTDQEHEHYKCLKPCSKVLCRYEHVCPKRCCDECDVCQVLVTKMFPKCGHEQILPCYKSDVCQEPCEEILECGHTCMSACGEECMSYTECTVIVGKDWPCGHKLDVMCSQNPSNYKCDQPCKQKMACDHVCPLMCSEPCISVTECKEPVIDREWPCGHKLDVKCYQNPTNYQCHVPCTKQLECGHICPLTCTKTCISASDCDRLVRGKEWPCGHKLDVQCFMNPSNYQCPEFVLKTLPCAHNAWLKCSYDINTYDCKQIVQVVLCERKCENNVPCYMHKTDLVCQMTCSKVCEKNEQHVYNSPCQNYDSSTCPCECSSSLPCGHRCQGTCGVCQSGGIHKICDKRCQRKLPCLHECKQLCGEVCGPCNSKIVRMCLHGKRSVTCGNIDNVCMDKCLWICKHSKCSQLCHEVCDRKPCLEPCDQMNKCGHKCPGACGDPCIDVCPICDDGFYQRMYTALEILPSWNDRFVRLLPCNHVVTVQFMDTYVERYKNLSPGTTKPFQLLECPMCHTHIEVCPRYNKTTAFCQNMMDQMRRTVAVSHKFNLMGKQSDDDTKLLNQLKVLILPHNGKEAFYGRRSIGCFVLLDETDSLIQQICLSKAKRTGILGVLQHNQNVYKQILTMIISNQLNKTELDELITRVKIFYTLCQVHNILRQTGERSKKETLVQVLAELEMMCTGYRPFEELNHALETVKKTSAVDCAQYINQCTETFTDFTLQRHWLICSHGHAFPVPVGDTGKCCPVCEFEEFKLQIKTVYGRVHPSLERYYSALQDTLPIVEELESFSASRQRGNRNFRRRGRRRGGATTADDRTQNRHTTSNPVTVQPSQERGTVSSGARPRGRSRTRAGYCGERSRAGSRLQTARGRGQPRAQVGDGQMAGMQGTELFRNIHRGRGRGFLQRSRRRGRY